MFDTLIPLTLTLARAYGIGTVIVALAALLASQRIKSALADFDRNPGLTFLSALFAIILGLMLVVIHSVWADLPAILVSMLGWIILAKGIVLLAAPEPLLKIARASDSTSVVRLWGVIALALGVLYLVIGFGGHALAGL